MICALVIRRWWAAAGCPGLSWSWSTPGSPISDEFRPRASAIAPVAARDFFERALLDFLFPHLIGLQRLVPPNFFALVVRRRWLPVRRCRHNSKPTAVLCQPPYHKKSLRRRRADPIPGRLRMDRQPHRVSQRRLRPFP